MSDAIDSRYMQAALTLAKKGEFTAHPNPLVGCVLVKDDKVIGQGFHQKAGHAHAEVNALKEAGENAKNATCYVNLEPCAHQGRTGPCTEALIQAGVKRVVFANSDPYPLVAGKGAVCLQQAGIAITQGVLGTEARTLNLGYFSRIERSKPLVRAKIAISLDGRVALASGESQWITSSQARQLGHYWRARSGAILTTQQTVAKDNCRLTVRNLPSSISALPSNWQMPLRIVVDTALNGDPNAAIFKESGPILIAVGDAVSLERQQAWLLQFPSHSIRLLVCPQKRNKLDMNFLLKKLAEEGINELLIETGGRFVGALLTEGLIDELLIYMAPVLLGNEAQPLAVLPGISTLKDKIKGQFTTVNSIGPDLAIHFNVSEFARI